MKYVSFSFLLIISLLSACNSDDDNILNFVGDEFGYDGPNSTSPFLPSDFYEAAAYFPTGILGDQGSRRLKDVNFFMLDIPETCIVRIYGQGSNSSPGPILFEEDVSGRIQAPAWNRFRLDEADRIDVSGGDFWISVAFSIGGQNPQQSIGCDAGPNVEGGDWIFFGRDNQWQTFRQRTGGESINWNIRGVLE